MPAKTGYTTVILRFTNRSLALFLVHALFLVSCQSLQIPQSPLLAALEHKSGRLAFVGLDGNIYTMNQAGKDLVNITLDASLSTDEDSTHSYFYPTWSPDGNHLAFIGFYKKSGRKPEVSIYTAGSDGANVTNIYSDLEHQPFYLYWLPNSKELSFLSGTPNDKWFTLEIVPAEGGETYAVGRGAPFYWAWSPNSETLATNSSSLAESGTVTGRLAVVRIQPQLQQNILAIRPSVFQSPVFSPDGNYLVVAVQDRPDSRYLLLTTNEGQPLRKLADFDGRVAFDWSPDGQNLAYISGITARPFGILGSLGIIDMSDPTNPDLSDPGISGVMAFYWSPNGEKIAYFEPKFDNNDISQSPELFLQLSVLDVTSGNVAMLGAFQSPDVILTQMFPHFDQYQRSSTIWSPDGNYLVINALTEDEEPGIFVVNADGNFAPRLITQGLMPFWSRN